MSAEENKALVHRMYDLLNQRKLDAYLDLIAPDYVGHFTDRDMSKDQEKRLDERWYAAFPDVVSTIDDVVAEGDKVAYRVTHRGTHNAEFMGIPPTGKKFEMTNSGMVRVAGGKVLELWATIDSLHLMQQLGMILITASKKQ